jgi:hypothetical protein
MSRKKIVYPRSLKDIPRWRQKEIARDLLWFSKYSITERFNYVDREWDDIQAFIKAFGISIRKIREKH